MKRSRDILTGLAVLSMISCGSEDPSPPSGDSCTPTTGRYLPLAVGATWAYRVSDPSLGELTKTSTVEALEDVGGPKTGIEAYRTRTTKVDGYTLSWQEDTGTAVRRHKELDLAGATETEEWYDAYKLRVDEAADHTNPGAAWTESYTETTIDRSSSATTTSDKSEQWLVVAAGESVTVPAGTFCALRVNRLSSSSSGGGSDKTYWFAPGVGKVKEMGGSVEELTSYSSP